MLMQGSHQEMKSSHYQKNTPVIISYYCMKEVQSNHDIVIKCASYNEQRN